MILWNVGVSSPRNAPSCPMGEDSGSSRILTPTQVAQSSAISPTNTIQTLATRVLMPHATSQVVTITEARWNSFNPSEWSILSQISRFSPQSPVRSLFPPAVEVMKQIRISFQVPNGVHSCNLQECFCVSFAEDRPPSSFFANLERRYHSNAWPRVTSSRLLSGSQLEWPLHHCVCFLLGQSSSYCSASRLWEGSRLFKPFPR